ncbi:DUF262 domain-containing protein [Agrococcus sediminis]|uniref:DUF262 domain-containing protein n=1 Tax=Agrococcus sediminis TaxID=2599924 RepID=A0A5M8QIW2_9MICO|nr:DUF262 domain-containing protein [Agrococcus sediminis]KAA6435965.1 DUF262 domain-containing protein [Agrococcus sediminis]
MTHTVTQHSINTILSWVQGGQVAIPEIQRPFVWNSTKVRDLIDSLYRGYPVGFLITWNTHDVRLKDGSSPVARQILIDGQQRVTALTTALVGLPVVDKNYARRRMQIAFNPLEERFETFTPVMRNDPAWIKDVAEMMSPTAPLTLVPEYLAANPGVDQNLTIARIARLLEVKNRQVGVINLDAALDIETVSEIFVRINSSGARLTPADFAMSRIASYGERGSRLRKQIDYFSHLAEAPAAADLLESNDPEFAASPEFRRIAWLRSDSSDLYDPKYQDILRVAGLVGFHRGRMSAVVSALSGTDPATKKVRTGLADESFDRLDAALTAFSNEHDFKHFRMVLASAGYTSAGLLTSTNAVNFAYALYLILRRDRLPHPTIQSIVRRWFVMSMLTGRSSGSFETQWELDLRRIDEIGAEAHLDSIERSELSDGFWTEAMPLNMQTSSTRSPFFTAFLAAQIRDGSTGFLSDSVSVASMLGDTGQGDIHHLFPKAYLTSSGINDRTLLNQVANYVVTETPVNIRIGELSPSAYMERVVAQLETETPDIGAIRSREQLDHNFRANAVPLELAEFGADRYLEFLELRRRTMADRVRGFYESLR